MNMMADKALRATERQFTRLVSRPGPGRPVEDLVVFTLPQLERSVEADRYIKRNYRTFAQVRQLHLDALIITGVNLSDPRLEIQPFWTPLQEVLAWAEAEVATTLCSCLATHAVMQFRFGQKRRPLVAKLWGVFQQEVAAPDHPLTTGLPASIWVPHSRHNDVNRSQFLDSGLAVLVEDEQAGVHLACDADLKLVLMQGHPEYDTISLLKEFKREAGYFQTGRRREYPPLPENYLDQEGTDLMAGLRRQAMAARQAGRTGPEFSETEAAAHLVNNWAEPTAKIFANWLDQAAQLNRSL